MEKQTLGFIGAGKLATPIIHNLIESGYQLYCYNRTKEKLATFKNEVTICDHITEVAHNANIIFSLIADDKALRQICTDENGLLSSMQPGSIHVSMSTVSPAIAAEMEKLHQQKGFIYIASPIMGRPEAVVAKKLGICIAGENVAKEKIKKILPDMGAVNIVDFGEKASAANVAKLGINFMIASAMETMTEAFDMVAANDVEPQQFYDLFSQTLFNCPIYKNYGNIILSKNFDDAQFYARLGLKDMMLVNKTADAKNINMPTARVLKENYQKVVDIGLGEKDWTIVGSLVNGE